VFSDNLLYKNVLGVIGLLGLFIAFTFVSWWFNFVTLAFCSCGIESVGNTFSNFNCLAN
jgi:type III secretory pathway component EscU